MSFLWLLVWLLSGTPSLHLWNAWTFALGVCIILDVFGTGSKT